MNLSTIRDEWRVPARLGQRVTAPGVERPGTITGNTGTWISVTFDHGLKLGIHPAILTYLKG